MCDLCEARGPASTDDSVSGAERLAHERGWRVIRLDDHGNKAHFCKACGGRKAEDVLREELSRAAEGA